MERTRCVYDPDRDEVIEVPIPDRDCPNDDDRSERRPDLYTGLYL